MAHPERMQIWGDRDSSNDARSSDDEEVVRDGGKGKREVEIPSSDVESKHEESDVEDDALRSSQPRPQSAFENEDENAIEDNSEDKAALKNVIEISSEEGSDNDEEAEEDEFAGFDVKPEEKEFLKELLNVAPPEEVKILTGKTRRHSDPLSDIMPGLKTTKNVGSFAKDHPFREQDTWTTVELQEYIDDVYEFALAAGMSEFHANLEVQKATGAWKLQRRLLFDNKQELEVEQKEHVKNLDFVVEPGHQEVYLAKEQLREEGHGKQKKRKRDALGEGLKASKPAREFRQFAQSEDTRTIETRFEDRDSVRKAKRRKKSEKKARRRDKRRAKEMALSVTSEATYKGLESHHAEEVEKVITNNTRLSAIPASKTESSCLTGKAPLPAKQKCPQVEKPRLQGSRSYYAEETPFSTLKNVTCDDMSLSTADKKSVGLTLKKQRREKVKNPNKKTKLGPKTSEYFAKSVPHGLPFSTILKDDVTTPLKAKNVEGPKPHRNYGEEMDQMQVVNQPLAKPETSGPITHPDQIKDIVEARQAVKNAPVLVKEASRENGHTAPSKTNSEVKAVQKKKKNRNHKRHRNKNRLAGKLSVRNEGSGNITKSYKDETGDLPLREKGHCRLQKPNLDRDAGKEQDQDLAALEEPTVEHENSNKPSIKQTVSQSAPDVNDHGGRPNKRRDRGRKSKTKMENVESPDVGEAAAAEPSTEPAAAFSDVTLKSIEPIEHSKKKRTRAKHKSREGKFELIEVSESAYAKPLTELANTNSKASKEKRRSHSCKRALSVDAMDIGNRPSNQSSKVHHSQ